jgi:hypothetical protein
VLRSILSQTSDVSRPSRAILYLAITLIMLPTAAFACQQKYVVEDRTTSSIVEVSYQQTGEWSANLLSYVISPGGKQMIIIAGGGPSKYKATLSSGEVVIGQAPDICSLTQIIIFGAVGSAGMVIR